MSKVTSLEKSIQRAVSYTQSQKRFNPACEIINGLISSIIEYLKSVESHQSDLEIDNLELEYLRAKNKRLKRIISLYDGNPDFEEIQIEILDSLKDSIEFYSGDFASIVLAKYMLVDALLKVAMPEKETRPKSIDHLNKAYKILSQNYGNTKN